MSVLDNSCIETGLLCRNAFRSTVLVISFKVRPSHVLQCVLQMVIKLLPVAANKAMIKIYIPGYFINIKCKLKRIIDPIELL